MAYKFQFGTTKLSGSTTFEEAVVGESTISGSGIISGLRLVLDPSSGGAVGSIMVSLPTLTLSDSKMSLLQSKVGLQPMTLLTLLAKLTVLYKPMVA